MVSNLRFYFLPKSLEGPRESHNALETPFPLLKENLQKLALITFYKHVGLPGFQPAKIDQPLLNEEITFFIYIQNL